MQSGLMMEEELWKGLLAEDMVGGGAFGCNPQFARDYSSVQEWEIMKGFRHPRTVAFGEIGPDYSHKNNTKKAWQKEVCSE